MTGLWIYCDACRRMWIEWLCVRLPFAPTMVCFRLFSWDLTCRFLFRISFCLPLSLWFGTRFGMFSPAAVVLKLDFFPFLGGVDSLLVLSVAPFWLKQHVHPDVRLRVTPSFWSMMILLRSETELYISAL